VRGVKTVGDTPTITSMDRFQKARLSE